MASPLDVSRWSASPEKALRLSIVSLAAGAVVPALVSFRLAMQVMTADACVVWVTVLTTLAFAYSVARLSPARIGAWRAPAAFALSVVGGALNGLVAGAVCGQFFLGNEAAVVGTYGAFFGLGYGAIFGLGNAWLVEVARRSSRFPSIMGAGRTVTRLAASVALLLLVALALPCACRDEIRAALHESSSAAGASITVGLGFAGTVMLSAAALAISAAHAQRRRRRWIESVSRGDEPGYRVLPEGRAPSATALALIDDEAAASALELPAILVRVDLCAGFEAGAYRQAERLIPLARLGR